MRFNATFRNLLSMQSGIPDFDTANPNPHGKDLDPFRATVYANPSEDFLEPGLMTLPWVATHNLTSAVGTGFHYSSTNFGLLGLILAGRENLPDYRDYNQSSFLQGIPKHITGFEWAQHGSPRDHGVVPGYDRTDYNGQDPNKTGGVNVEDVHGVFSGWSASDFVGTPSALAEIGYELWGKDGKVLPAKYVAMMVPGNKSFYGFASQNVGLMGIAGPLFSEYTKVYGHLGATYGYDSIYGYNPKLDVSIGIASNIETQSQTQPSEVFCGVYNRVKNYLLGEAVQMCTYTTKGYYSGQCSCKPQDVIVV